jgi:hypothetical protein
MSGVRRAVCAPALRSESRRLAKNGPTPAERLGQLESENEAFPELYAQWPGFVSYARNLSIWRREEAVVELNFPDGLVME